MHHVHTSLFLVTSPHGSIVADGVQETGQNLCMTGGISVSIMLLYDDLV